ncbi:MAG TPA: hypothetical protein DCY75_07670, partial [Clostridiales bacterium]|nr:hypothetical protein [Clostridiales bacterium]
MSETRLRVSSKPSVVLHALRSVYSCAPSFIVIPPLVYIFLHTYSINHFFTNELQKKLINIAKKTNLCYNQINYKASEEWIMIYYSTPYMNYSRGFSVPDPASSIPMHSHATYELYYFISGNCEYTVEGVSNHLQPYTLLIIRANEAHRPSLHDSSLYERVCIHFRPEAVDTFDPERRLLIPFDERPLGQNNLYAPHVTRESGLTDCFDTLAKSDEDKYDNGIRVHTQFCRILCILSDLYKEKTATSADVNPLVMAIVDYINRNLVQSLSLERLCNEFYLSKSHLQRLFRDATGSTVWDYILL